MKINYPMTMSLLFAAFFTLSIWMYMHKAKTLNDMLIADNVIQLAEIFETIHKDCTILSFEHQKNNINFLNVISFEGSEVGPMNLKYPDKCQGAYLKDNPTMQEQEYQIVKTDKGYFIAPGDGVRLSKGHIIAKDIILNKDTDFELLIKSGILVSGQWVMAAKLELGKPHKKKNKKSRFPSPEIIVQAMQSD